eukprot:12303196-Prorocentrum_lima.AAC.1
MVGCLLGSKRSKKPTARHMEPMCTNVVVLLSDGTEKYAPPHAVGRIVQRLLECGIVLVSMCCLLYTSPSPRDSTSS